MPQRNSSKSARQFSPQDWVGLLKLRVGVPTHQFPFVLKPAGHQLFRLADDVYSVVWNLSHIADGNPPETPRVARVFWAKNWQAAKLIGYHHPRIDRARLSAGTGNPPLELLDNRAPSWANRDTYRAARRDKWGIAESAEYDHNGAFKFKTVWLRPLQIYYASRLKRAEELPIGVEVVLIHSKTKSA
jgi:hypothetical protein